jgi:hypothetical protein
MFWFDKTNPNVLFADIRSETHTLCDGRALEIKPDIIMDFRQMPFDNDVFHLVVFDPPHLKKLGQNSWMALKYGKLLPTWQSDIKAGFDECMRVLKPNGVLIFKWNQTQIGTNVIINLLGQMPLIGHKSGKRENTEWLTFMKL